MSLRSKINDFRTDLERSVWSRYFPSENWEDLIEFHINNSIFTPFLEEVFKNNEELFTGFSYNLREPLFIILSQKARDQENCPQSFKKIKAQIDSLLGSGEKFRNKTIQLNKELGKRTDWSSGSTADYVFKPVCFRDIEQLPSKIDEILSDLDQLDNYYKNTFFDPGEDLIINHQRSRGMYVSALKKVLSFIDQNLKFVFEKKQELRKYVVDESFLDSETDKETRVLSRSSFIFNLFHSLNCLKSEANLRWDIKKAEELEVFDLASFNRSE